MMILFENHYVTLSIDESVPCLEWVGKRFMPSAAFRASEKESLLLYLEYQSRYPKMQWFVDARYIDVLSPSDMKWVVENVLPEFVAVGLKKESFVVPSQALGRACVKIYVSEVGNIVRIKLFDNICEAKSWLKYGE